MIDGANSRIWLAKLLVILVTMGFVHKGYASHNEIYDSVNSAKGGQLYNVTCVPCHGPDGKGILPSVPDFRGKDSPLLTKDHELLLQHMDEGFQSPGSMMAMPPKGGNSQLSEQDLADILEYMLEEFASEAP